MICLVTGGARSGKSSFAQNQALMQSSSPIYVATSKVTDADKEFADRVRRHQEDRNERWLTYEEPLYISGLPLDGKVVVIDCVTLWLSNFFSLHKSDVDRALYSFRKEIDALASVHASFFVVTNELGMGLHAETEIGRKFTDLQGWANQYVAAKADKVVFMVSGIPITIKEKGNEA